MNKKYFLIALLFNIFAYAQDKSTFYINEQFYVNGDALSIGNSILSKHKTKEFNTLDIVNDQIDMKYVDVDKDKSTFSSSSATLELSENNNKIVYAGLYWSGVYGYKKGVKRINGNRIFFKGKGVRDSIFNVVKFKTPNSDYKVVEGKVLFDGFKNTRFKESAPYVCYADVTNLMNDNALNGEYTVANVKATQGFTLGGSSAGWILYVVYENPENSPKQITTYHGLAVIENQKPLDIISNQYTPINKGSVNASITMAALEGDSQLKQDQSLIFSPQDSTYVPLFNKIRDSKNFFNSTITTKENQLFINRVPNSLNTLGFDLAQIKVPNEKNNIINNNSTTTTIRFSTKSDRFYLFFNAFETEISPDFFDLQKSPEDFIALDKNETQITDNQVVAEHETNSTKVLDEDEIELNKAVAEGNPNVENAVNKTIPEDFEQLIIDINNSEGIESSELQSGYYVITNVFAKKDNAERWNALLLEKGYQTELFVNPKNNWYYISVFNTEDIYEALYERKRLDALDYLEGIWVFKVNIDSPTI